MIDDYLMVGLTSPSDTKVMNAPAPPLIAPDSVRERLVDIVAEQRFHIGSVPWIAEKRGKAGSMTS